MNGVSVSVDTHGVPAHLQALAMRLKDLTPVARDVAGHMVRRIKGMFLKVGPEEESPAGGPPATRRGGRGLLGSIASEIDPGGSSFRVGSNLVYAEIMNKGGTIRMKSKPLTIPIAPEAKGKRARDFDGLFLVPAAKGADPEKKGILAVKDGEGIKPMFALRGSVTLPARPFLDLVPEDEDYLDGAIARAVDHELGLS